MIKNLGQVYECKEPMSRTILKNVFFNSLGNHSFEYLTISFAKEPMKAKLLKNWTQMSQLFQAPCEDQSSITNKVNRMAMLTRPLRLLYSPLQNDSGTDAAPFYFKAVCNSICFFFLESYGIWTGREKACIRGHRKGSLPQFGRSLRIFFRMWIKLQFLEDPHPPHIR